MVKLKIHEPVVNPDNHNASLSNALYWYHQEKDKKDARAYLKAYISEHFTKQDVKVFDKLPDNRIINTYAWISRMLSTGALTLKDNEYVKFDNYLQSILDTSDYIEEEEPVEADKPVRPSVRDNMEEKVREYLGELEGAIDDFTVNGNELNLYNDLKARAIPQPYCAYIDAFLKKKASEYVFVYETTDKEYKDAYSHLGKRKLTQLIKMLSEWLEDLERYAQFKKANRKPRPKKVKTPAQQIAKLKYKKEDTELGIKSVFPSEMVGASQVWIYNVKYKKLSAYRCDSTIGMQVKGSTLQNYDPDQCEQKTLRKPGETLKKVLDAGKIQLRKILSELTTKESTVNGRINEDCLIIRVIK